MRDSSVWTRGGSRVFPVCGENAARAARPTERGFTLLEVLIATVIMAIAIGGLLSAITTSMNNAARLTDRDRAILLARQQMNELLLVKPAPKGAPLQGLWDPALTGGRPCGWNASITLFEAPANAPPGSDVLDHVQLEVWCGDGDAKRTFTMEAFRRDSLTPADAALSRGARP
jgi:general secretion pathway protein I